MINNENYSFQNFKRLIYLKEKNSKDNDNKLKTFMKFQMEWKTPWLKLRNVGIHIFCHTKATFEFKKKKKETPCILSEYFLGQCQTPYQLNKCKLSTTLIFWMLQSNSYREKQYGSCCKVPLPLKWGEWSHNNKVEGQGLRSKG